MTPRQPTESQEPIVPPPDLPEDPTMTFSRERQDGVPPPTMPATLTLSRWTLSKPPTGEEQPISAEASVGDLVASIDLPTEEHVIEAPAYQLRRIVGKGGYGEVWEATQSSLGRSIAVKKLRDDIYERASEDAAETRQLEVAFRQEAITTASLEHPNIVPVHDLGIDEYGHPLLAMKLVKGQPWNKMIREDGDMAVADFLAKHLPILIDVAQAVAFAHSRGVVHRDIKPSQVMVGEFGEVLLMDWGLAVVCDEDAAKVEIPELISSRMVPTMDTATSPSGTPAFMAPEQTNSSAAKVGRHTDIFLLGGTLYYLLTLTAPYNAKDAMAAFYQAIECNIESPEDRASDREISPELSMLAMTCLAKLPEERPGVREFIDGLTDYLSGATRRRESTALTNGVADRLQHPERSYEELSEWDNMLVRALGLWPENPRANPLRQFVLTEYARFAIDNGDLKLARVQAERLEDATEREGIMSEINGLESRGLRAQKQRRMLLMATGFLVAGIALAGFVVYGATEDREQEQMRKELAEATASHGLRAAQLLQQVAELRRREEDLGQRLSRFIPRPERLQEEGAFALDLSVHQKEIDALLAERQKLFDERKDLEEQVSADKIEPIPFDLLLAEANLILATARTRQDYLKAFDLYQNAQRQRGNHPLPLTGMGIAAARAGLVAPALKYFEDATSATLALNGSTHPDYAKALALEAEAIVHLGEYRSENSERYDRAKSVLEERWGTMALTLAVQALDAGRVDEAIDYTSPTLASFLHAYGSEHVLTAKAMATMGRAHQMRGEYAKAEDLMRKALAQRERLLGTRNIETIDSIEALACLLDERGRPLEAAPLHARALELVHILLGDGAPRTGEQFLASALNQREVGSLTEAQTYARQGVKLLEDSLGIDHPRTAQALLETADIELSAGAFAEANDCASRAAEVYEGIGGERYWRAIAARGIEARALARLGKGDQAVALLNRIRPAATSDQSRILWFAALADVHEATGSLREALDARQRQIALLRGMPSEGRTLSDALMAESRLLLAGRDSARAARSAAESYLEAMEVVGREHPLSYRAMMALSACLDSAGDATGSRLAGQRAFEIARRSFGEADGKTRDACERLHELVPRDSSIPAGLRWEGRLALLVWLAQRDFTETVSREDIRGRWLQHHRDLVEHLLSGEGVDERIPVALTLHAWALCEVADIHEDAPIYRTFVRPAIQKLDLGAALVSLPRPPADLWPDPATSIETYRLRDYLASVAPYPDWLTAYPMLSVDMIPPTGPMLEQAADDLARRVLRDGPATGGRPLAAAK